MPPPANISALSLANASDPCRASQPITTELKLFFFINARIPVAVLLTTARFIQEGPGPIGPRIPAVPNCKKPAKHLSNSVLFSSSSHCFNWLAVFASGSLLIQSKTSLLN